VAGAPRPKSELAVVEGIHVRAMHIMWGKGRAVARSSDMPCDLSMVVAVRCKWVRILKRQ
jgi:hypothetical protein